MQPRLSKWVWLAAVLKLGLHLISSARGYGYFGDELYYIACAAHPDLGYVDHPPFSIWILALWQALFGDSLFALRLLAAGYGAAAVVLSGALARELDGRGPAQVLTAVVVALAPVNLVVHGYYSMNAVDIVVWLAAFVLLADALRTGRRSRWIGLGALLGIGLLNKLSVLWFGAGLAVGLLVTPHRRVLWTAGPWLAGALAGMVFLPHLVWQAAHDWPTLEFVRIATREKMLPVSPLDLFAQQVLVWNPFVVPLWSVGFVALMMRKGHDPGRLFAAIFVTTAAILIMNGTSRPNYLALAMPPLVAAGAIALERGARRREMRWPVPAAIALVTLVGLLFAPMSLPILKPDRLVAFSRAIGLSAPQMEDRDMGSLDQHFADMIGWEVVVDTVAGVYEGLPDAERARAAVLTVSYSGAGAIDLLGPSRGLPGAISPHNNYWLWGTGGADGSVMVLVGGSSELWSSYWQSVEAVAEWDCGYCMPDRNHAKVYVARDPRVPMDQIWSALRRFE